MLLAMDRFFRPTPTLVRPLGVSVLWAYVAALAGLVAELAVLVVTGLVAGAIWIIDRGVDVSSAITGAVRVGAWIVGPLALVAVVWVAAYGSTQQGSVPRAAVATPVALVAGVGLLLLQSIGFVAAALAVGWGVALPASGPSRAAVRGLPLVAAALALPRFDDVTFPVLAAALTVSPLTAALCVLLVDLPWRLAEYRRKAKPTPG
jgi:hypothetical protein